MRALYAVRRKLRLLEAQEKELKANLKQAFGFGFLGTVAGYTVAIERAWREGYTVAAHEIETVRISPAAQQPTLLEVITA